MNTSKYVALLRGINVGGNTKVEMVKLKKSFEELEFLNVATLLNSGNVVFESQITDVDKLTQGIETKLKTTFGFPIHVIIRTKKEIESLVAGNPFKDIVVTSDTRLYVTFLTGKSISLSSNKSDNIFPRLHKTGCEVFSVFQLSEKSNTTDEMKQLAKEFGKNITTRNWNTILKVQKQLS